MKTDWKGPILALFGLASLAVAVPMGFASAQQSGQGTVSEVAQRAQGTTPQDRVPFQVAEPMPGQRMGMMGGPPAMVADNNFLYILQGNMIFKVNKATLETTGQRSLPMPQPRFGGEPGGAVPGPRGGGGARTSAGGAARNTSGGETGTVPPPEEE